MKEYLLYKRKYNEKNHLHFLAYKKLEQSDSSITFKTLEILKNPLVISLLFLKSEQEEQYIDGEIGYVYSENVGKEYYIGKTYYYNDIPRNANFSAVHAQKGNKEKLSNQNPKCVVTRNNVVFLIDKCEDVYLDECEIDVIDPDELDKIKKITKEGIVYKSENELKNLEEELGK